MQQDNSTITNKKILLIGGTQGVGKQVALQLLENKVSFRLACRDVAKASKVFNHPLFSTNVEVVEADITNPETYATIVQGINYVICAVSASSGWTLASKVSPKDVDYVATVQFARYCHVSHVERFLLVSSCKVTKAVHPVKLLLDGLFGRILHWKYKAENEIRALYSINDTQFYTIIRPSGLTDREEDNISVVFDQGDNGGPSKVGSRRNIAVVIVKCLLDAKYELASRNVTFECYTNPDPLTHTTNWDAQFGKLKKDSQFS